MTIFNIGHFIARGKVQPCFLIPKRRFAKRKGYSLAFWPKSCDFQYWLIYGEIKAIALLVGPKVAVINMGPIYRGKQRL